jgi:multiple sugar transport system permease protein
MIPRKPDLVLFLGPLLLGLFCFNYLPMAASLGLSFCHWDLIHLPTWEGLNNYKTLLGMPDFYGVLANTLVYVSSSIFLELGLGLSMALILNQKLKGMAWFRNFFFIPYITPMVSVSLAWGWFYDPKWGLLNGVWHHVFHLNEIAVLYNPKTAMAAVIALRVWKDVGYTMLILLAGLQSISGSLYEAAKIDGASAWQRFLNITLPMLSPTLFFVGVMSGIQGFQSFDAIYLLTQGGPQNSTQVLVHWLYQKAFLFYQVGQASALAYILCLIILCLTALQWGARKYWVLHE